jgi:8-oxo-dGTP diphosphatase
MNYVLGFMFCDDCQMVALIRKDRPAWQAGKLNGIGGKMEDADRSPLCAMIREFREETGAETIPQDWKHFADMKGEDFDGKGIYRVHCFTCFGDVDALDSITSEKVRVLRTDQVTAGLYRSVDNLPWLTALASTVVRGFGPNFTLINYNPPRS